MTKNIWLLSNDHTTRPFKSSSLHILAHFLSLSLHFHLSPPKLIFNSMSSTVILLRKKYFYTLLTNRKSRCLASFWLNFLYMSDWIITEAYVTWRTLEVTGVALLSLFSVIGRRQVWFKSKQMFCVSVHSEMKKTRCDWQWQEHAQLSHPTTVFSAKEFGRNCTSTGFRPVLRWRHPPLTAKILTIAMTLFCCSCCHSTSSVTMSGEKPLWLQAVGLNQWVAGLIRSTTAQTETINAIDILNCETGLEISLAQC